MADSERRRTKHQATGSSGRAFATRPAVALLVSISLLALAPAAGAGALRQPRPSTARRTSATWPLVVLDPGHNGGDASHLREIDKLVYAGYGRWKPCNTTGTSTDSGYPEHAFTWDVAKRVRATLHTHHVAVRMTRYTDLAGLNRSTKPTTFLEIGNMRNAGDAHKQRSSYWRWRIAKAITAGILTYLAHR